MELWRRIWRDGLAPQLSTSGLQALYQGLAHDDPRLLQRFTADVPAARAFRARKIEAACALGYCAWKGDGVKRLGQVLDHFENVCTRADESVGELAASNHFLNWYDQTPRAEMRRQLLGEVERVLRQRTGLAA